MSMGMKGKKLQRIQLGYGIDRSNLDRDDYRIQDSSVRFVGKFWCGSDNYCFKDFIHVNRSLGHLLNQEGLPALPSPQERTPKGNHYFTGGCIVGKCRSRNGGEIDAIQVEFPKKLRFGWGSDQQRRAVRAVLRFLKLNYVLHVKKYH